MCLRTRPPELKKATAAEAQGRQDVSRWRVVESSERAGNCLVVDGVWARGVGRWLEERGRRWRWISVVAPRRSRTDGRAVEELDRLFAKIGYCLEAGSGKSGRLGCG